MARDREIIRDAIRHRRENPDGKLPLFKGISSAADQLLYAVPSNSVVCTTHR